MKFLADMGVSMSTIRTLREHGHKAVHLREHGLQRLPDDLIIDKAEREGCVVLTFDLDFGELMAIAKRALPSVVIFRMRNQTPTAVTARLLELLRLRSDDLGRGAVVIVEDFRIRLRRLPLLPEGDDGG